MSCYDSKVAAVFSPRSQKEARPKGKASQYEEWKNVSEKIIRSIVVYPDIPREKFGGVHKSTCKWDSSEIQLNAPCNVFPMAITPLHLMLKERGFETCNEFWQVDDNPK